MPRPIYRTSTPRSSATSDPFTQWEDLCALRAQQYPGATAFLEGLGKELRPFASEIGVNFLHFAAGRISGENDQLPEWGRAVVRDAARLLPAFILCQSNPLGQAVASEVVRKAVIPMLWQLGDPNRGRSEIGGAPEEIPLHVTAIEGLTVTSNHAITLLQEAITKSGGDVPKIIIESGLSDSPARAEAAFDAIIRTPKVVQLSRFLAPIGLTLAGLLSAEPPSGPVKPVMTVNDLGLKMRVGVAACGLAKEVVAEKMGLAVPALNSFLNPSTDVPIGHLQELAAALGWSMVRILEVDITDLISSAGAAAANSTSSNRQGVLTTDQLHRRLMAAVDSSPLSTVELANSIGKYVNPKSAQATFSIFLRHPNPPFLRVCKLVAAAGKDINEIITGIPREGPPGRPLTMGIIRQTLQSHLVRLGIEDTEVLKMLQTGGRQDVNDIPIFKLQDAASAAGLRLDQLIDLCYGRIDLASIDLAAPRPPVGGSEIISPPPPQRKLIPRRPRAPRSESGQPSGPETRSERTGAPERTEEVLSPVMPPRPTTISSPGPEPVQRREQSPAGAEPSAPRPPNPSGSKTAFNYVPPHQRTGNPPEYHRPVPRPPRPVAARQTLQDAGPRNTILLTTQGHWIQPAVRRVIIPELSNPAILMARDELITAIVRTGRVPFGALCYLRMSDVTFHDKTKSLELLDPQSRVVNVDLKELIESWNLYQAALKRALGGSREPSLVPGLPFAVAADGGTVLDEDLSMGVPSIFARARNGALSLLLKDHSFTFVRELPKSDLYTLHERSVSTALRNYEDALIGRPVHPQFSNLGFLADSRPIAGVANGLRGLTADEAIVSHT